ncbi:hypothetical protein BDM02DRAFT_3106515 [Thelephora ganbajun]|uniref:Uncharacterized protein n=1 Tax=Thelephora ganbajun TaxID=370292 RepID=A0ACB6ZXL8_THEGA|nr:hypothetical protein BDM02DRAFT_3106515 [Thelephora ganbajun]
MPRVPNSLSLHHSCSGGVLVQGVVNAILKKSNVAILGMGGSGKTSIAKLITNAASIVGRFGKEQYFVKCNDFNPFFGNFLDRVV